MARPLITQSLLLKNNMLRNFIFSFFILFTSPFIWANDSDNFIENEIAFANTLLNTCTISISDIQGSISGQTVAYQEAIEPIIISFATDCNETLVLNFAAGQLPTGINYTFTNNQLIIGGTIEDETPQEYTWIAEVNNSIPSDGVNPPVSATTSISLSGSITVTPTLQSDFEGPVMSAFALYPPTIDLTNGAVTVSATVRITDQTGVATPSSNFGGAYITGTPSGNIYFSHWVRVSGDQFDGIYECFKTIEPDQIPEGDYTLRAETTNIRDLNGFNATPPPAINVSVINPISSDFEGPVMSAFALYPPTIDLTNGAVTVSATVRITDQTGVATPSSNFGGAYITGTPSGNIYFSHWVRVSGDQFDGIYECFKTIEPDQIPEGDYTLRAETTNIRDLNGFNATPPPAINVSVINTPQGCEFAIVTNPFDQSLDFCLGEAITPFEFRLESNCNSSSLSIDVYGLPEGIDYLTSSTDSFTILTFQGTPTTAGTNFVNVNITSNNAYTSVSGIVFIDGNCNGTGSGTDSCDFTVITNPFDQSLDFCLGEAITPFEFRLESNCNSSSLSIDVYGLPEGIDYLTSSTDSFTILTFQGTPTTAGTNFVNVNITSNNAYTSVSGIFFIDGNCNGTGSGTDSCDFTVITNPFDQSLDFCLGEAITPFEFRLESNCNSSSLSIDVYGLPEGIDYLTSSTDSFTILTFQGTPTTAGTNFVNVNITSNNAYTSVSGIFFIDGNCNGTGSGTGTNTTGQTDADLDGVPDQFDECPDTPFGQQVDSLGCPYVQEDCALNVEGNLDRTICIDEEIEPIRLALDSSCTSSSIDASIIGLPPGLSYLMQNAEDGNEFIIQGTAFIPGDYQVTVFFYDLNNFIEQTINGRIFVESDCSANTTGSQNDRDQDGVNDEVDVCPNTQQGVAVDENGCAISEGDCTITINAPNSFEEEVTLCINRSMEPIIFTIDTNCNNTSIDTMIEGLPPGLDYYLYLTPYEKELVLYGLPYIPGSFELNMIITDTKNKVQKALSRRIIIDNDCEQGNTATTSYTFEDQDNDGVKDELDQCPDTKPGIAVDPKGCSANQQAEAYLGDDDNDGILNFLDACPDTSPGITVDPKGCSEEQGGNAEYIRDTDDDGVIDIVDVCPDTAAGDPVNEFGCSDAQLAEITDFDQDGVDNEFDQCPYTPAGQQVDENGCSVVDQDKDLDGVIDTVDACPNTPPGEYVDDYGCAVVENDSDLDGVSNELDQCPYSPPGIAVNEVGCSQAEQQEKEDTADDDGDGVINIIDRCPDTPEGTTVDENGCTPEESSEQASTDNDLDGINNEDDICPDTERGVAVNKFGCPLYELDSDFDKVNDNEDLCPNTPVGEPVNQFGCSIAQKEADLDMDGVPNEKDYCADTLPYFPVNINGCSEIQIAVDSDFDGIPNEFDQCSETLPLTEVDENGCSEAQRDDDQDGVVNAIDRCPDTAANEKVDPYGCAEVEVDGDDDQDGVNNSVDQCPGTPSGETVDSKGCAYKPPTLIAQSFEQKENSRDVETEEIRTFIGKVLYSDPNASNGAKTNVSLAIASGQEAELFELVGDSIFLIGRTDFEENPTPKFTIVATNNLNQSTEKEMVLNVLDIPNTKKVANFEVAVFDVENESTGAKVDYTRYLNPNIDKGVGKWKIKKKIVGGNDAHLFKVESYEGIPDKGNGKLSNKGIT